MTQNYFTTPNEIFSLGLSPGAFAVYSFLCRCENRRTHECWPSYSTIGAATRMSVNTVRKYVCALADKGLIRTEDTTALMWNGFRRNGNLHYTIQPLQKVLDEQRQTGRQKSRRKHCDGNAQNLGLLTKSPHMPGNMIE